ncbi:MAG: hypothetical protein D6812_09010, partial [Deltaproteobacteria bacterium]
TMEYVADGNLRDYFHCSLETKLVLAIKICHGLDFIHSQHIVHRDVKPDNVLIKIERPPKRGEPVESPVGEGDDLEFYRLERKPTKLTERPLAEAEEIEAEGRRFRHEARDPRNLVPKLTDFGLVKDIRNVNDRITMPGRTMGTLAYIAPEQARGFPVDPRTDLYSLGAVLYEMFVGVPPFGKGSEDAVYTILSRHIHEKPKPPREIAPYLPPTLERVILTLLEKDPRDRYPSAYETMSALTEVLADVTGGNTVEIEALPRIARYLFTPRFVGRQEELDLLHLAVRRIYGDERGRPSQGKLLSAERFEKLAHLAPVIAITGESGVGKSRFIEEFRRREQARGSKIYVTAPGSGIDGEETTRPYRAVGRLIQQILAEIRVESRQIAEGETVMHFDGSGKPSLRFHAAQRLAARRKIVTAYQRTIDAILPRRRPQRRLRPRPPFEKIQLLREIAQFFLELSQVTPLCLVIEDLHEVDEESVQAVSLIAQRLARYRRSGRVGDDMETQAYIFPELSTPTSALTKLHTPLDGDATLGMLSPTLPESAWDLEPTVQPIDTPNLLLCFTVDEARVARGSLLESLLTRGASTGQVGRLDLPPLSREEVGEMISTMLGQSLPPTMAPLVERIYEKAGGNPFFVQATLKSLLDSHKLERQRGRWVVDVESFTDLELPATIKESLGERILRLDSDTLALLQCAAVIGKAFHLRFLTELSGWEEARILPALERAIQGQFLREQAKDAEAFEFTHEALRDVLYERIPQGERVAWHKKIARHLSARKEAVDPKTLAHHYDRSGARVEAFELLVRSGEEARKASRNLEAIRCFQRAVTIAGEVEELRERIVPLSLRLGETMTLMGRIEDAIEVYEGLGRQLGEKERIAAAQVERHIGTAMLYKGDQARALAHYQNALRLLGGKMPTGRLGRFLSIGYRLTLRIVHDLLPFVPMLERIFLRDRPRYVALSEVFEGLSLIYYLFDLSASLDAHLRSINLAETLGNDRLKAQAYINHGIFLSSIPMPRRALKFQEKGLALFRRLEDMAGIAQAYYHLGLSHFFLGHLGHAHHFLTQSIEISERIGDPRMQAHALSLQAQVEYHFGRFEDAERMLWKGLAIAEDIDDRVAQTLILHTLSKLHGAYGKPEEALRLIRRAESLCVEAQMKTIYITVKRQMGRIFLQEGAFNEAIREFSISRNLIEQTHFLNSFTAETYLLLAEAALARYEHTAATRDSRRGRGEWKDIRSFVEHGRTLGQRYKLHLAHALRIAGSFAAFSGKWKEARRLWKESLDVARQMGSDFERAATYLEMGLRLSGREEKRAEAYLRTAHEMFRKMKAAHYLARIESCRALQG